MFLPEEPPWGSPLAPLNGHICRPWWQELRRRRRRRQAPCHPRGHARHSADAGKAVASRVTSSKTARISLWKKNQHSSIKRYQKEERFSSFAFREILSKSWMSYRLYIHRCDCKISKTWWRYIQCTSSTAQGGGGSFQNRKPIGEVGCCESRMAEWTDWWNESWLELCFLKWLQWSLGRSPHPQLLDVV